MGSEAPGEPQQRSLVLHGGEQAERQPTRRYERREAEQKTAKRLLLLLWIKRYIDFIQTSPTTRQSAGYRRNSHCHFLSRHCGTLAIKMQVIHCILKIPNIADILISVMSAHTLA